MVTGKILEQILKENLINYFSSFGFEYYHHYENTYFRKNLGLCQYIIEIQSKSFSIGGYNELGITYWDIEKIVSEVGLPGYDMEIYLKWLPFKKTIIDKKFTQTILGSETNSIISEEDCVIFSKNIIDYMENEGKKFFMNYSFLPNILEEMNNNQKESIYWSHGILKGTSEPFMSGLIISKLCNDPDYENKFEYVTNLYSAPENNLTAYLPYLEKLRERLKTVEPIYYV